LPPSVDWSFRQAGDISSAFWRVTNHTAAVHVGNRSRPGISSATSVGRKAQCQPSKRTKMIPTTTSRTLSAGESAPSANSGKAAIWIASAIKATTHAHRTLGCFSARKDSRNAIASPSINAEATRPGLLRTDSTRTNKGLTCLSHCCVYSLRRWLVLTIIVRH